MKYQLKFPHFAGKLLAEVATGNIINQETLWKINFNNPATHKKDAKIVSRKTSVEFRWNSKTTFYVSANNPLITFCFNYSKASKMTTLLTKLKTQWWNLQKVGKRKPEARICVVERLLMEIEEFLYRFLRFWIYSIAPILINFHHQRPHQSCGFSHIFKFMCYCGF